MTFRKSTLRLAAASALVASAAIGASAFAQGTPTAKEAAEVSVTRGPKAVADPTKLLPIPQDYHPKKTLWGEPDFTGTWPIDSIASIFFQRNDRYGNRFYLNQEELDAREKEILKLATLPGFAKLIIRMGGAGSMEYFKQYGGGGWPLIRELTADTSSLAALSRAAKELSGALSLRMTDKDGANVWKKKLTESGPIPVS